MSCDESVLKRSDHDIRVLYSGSLLALSSNASGLISPLAFGESNTKSRIKNTLRYKKPSLGISIAAVAAVVAVTVGFAATRTQETQPWEGVPQRNGWREESTHFNRITSGSERDNIAGRMGDGPESEIDTDTPEVHYDIPPVIYNSETGEESEVPGSDYDITFYFDDPSIMEKIFEPVPVQETTANDDRVKITLLTDKSRFSGTAEFETDYPQIITIIENELADGIVHTDKPADLEANIINKYQIELYNSTGGYSAALYHDTLYDEAYVVKDGGMYTIGTDFARYIKSLFENTSMNVNVREDAAELFQEYGWTLDYEINAMNSKLGDIESLSAFNPNAYYFAYNNELSKDIGLDMSGYDGEVSIEIYSIRESMPEEFYPIQDCRGIVVRKGAKIIGAYISAGRHSAFSACSLKGHRFETITSKSVNEWLAEVVEADIQDERLSKLTPEQVLAEYFTALDKGDYKTAEYCLSKSLMLGNLTANMPNSELFAGRIALQLTDAGFGAESSTDNVESAKLLNVDLIEDTTHNMKTFRVYINLQLRQELTINSGEQFWDCVMVCESPQTGWKITGFGH